MYNQTIPAPDLRIQERNPHLSMEHKLKTHPRWFSFTWTMDTRKQFEIRRSDRDFRGGDLITLYEYNPITTEFSGRVIEGRIMHVLLSVPGIEKDYFLLICTFSRFITNYIEGK